MKLHGILRWSVHIAPIRVNRWQRSKVADINFVIGLVEQGELLFNSNNNKTNRTKITFDNIRQNKTSNRHHRT